MFHKWVPYHLKNMVGRCDAKVPKEMGGGGLGWEICEDKYPIVYAYISKLLLGCCTQLSLCIIFLYVMQFIVDILYVLYGDS